MAVPPKLEGGDATPAVDSTAGLDAGASLLLVAGAGTFSSYTLERRDLVIGRADDCDVRVEHPVMSRHHAVLRPGPPATVQDLGSRNGTRVAGAVRRGSEPVALRANDSFHIGPFSFVLVSAVGLDQHSRSAREALQVVDPTKAGVPALVRDLAAGAASVVILGETGVGKEVLATTLHELSHRSGPLVRINCAALSETLLESELFGHEKGAFTGATTQKAGLLEAADGGTVFLDEVGELPLSTQAKLLRAIEHREVLRLGATRPVPIDVRFVAATNRDLPTEVDAGRFRRDLFFRLDGVTLVVPPLRERRHLIGPLALGFLEAVRRRTGSQSRLDAQALAALEGYAWPGNVRSRCASSSARACGRSWSSAAGPPRRYRFTVFFEMPSSLAMRFAPHAWALSPRICWTTSESTMASRATAPSCWPIELSSRQPTGGGQFCCRKGVTITVALHVEHAATPPFDSGPSGLRSGRTGWT